MIHNFILEVENTLSVTTCDQIIEKFEKDPRKVSGETGYGLDESRKVSTDLEIHDKEYWSETYKLLVDSLTSNLQIYAEKFDSFGGIERYGCSGFRIHKYTSEGYFNWHIDNYNKDVCSRILACIWYLNTVAEGGYTEFKHQQVKIQPIVGKLLLFPTGFEYVHRGVPPVDVDKYIVVSFIEHV